MPWVAETVRHEPGAPLLAASIYGILPTVWAKPGDDESSKTALFYSQPFPIESLRVFFPFVDCNPVRFLYTIISEFCMPLDAKWGTHFLAASFEIGSNKIER
jgi:hypothetical protein